MPLYGGSSMTLSSSMEEGSAEISASSMSSMSSEKNPTNTLRTACCSSPDMLSHWSSRSWASSRRRSHSARAGCASCCASESSFSKSSISRNFCVSLGDPRSLYFTRRSLWSFSTSFFFCGSYHASINLAHSLRTLVAPNSMGCGGGGGGGRIGAGMGTVAGAGFDVGGGLGASGAGLLACGAVFAWAPRRFGGMAKGRIDES